MSSRPSTPASSIAAGSSPPAATTVADMRRQLDALAAELAELKRRAS